MNLMMLHLLKSIQKVALPYFERNNSRTKMTEGEIRNPVEKLDTFVLANHTDNAYVCCCSMLEYLEKEYKKTSNG